MTNSLTDEFIKFLHQSPTAWHAVENAKLALSQTGFTELDVSAEWKLENDRGYFSVSEGALCAFRTPKADITKIHLVASHTDSPGFKLKPNPEFRKDNMTMLASEIYGAPLLTSWMNRDLGIAGRIFYVKEDNTIGNSLINIDDSPVVIPQLAIHLDREANEKGPTFNKQEHFSALAALDFDTSKSYLLHLFEKNIQEPYKYILSHDLFLYPIEMPKLLGSDMLASYRLDSLESVHACLSALKTSPSHNNNLNMAIFWNHEEIGSQSTQGAGSPLAMHLLERIFIGLGLSREHLLRLLPQSLCISVDLSQGVNPNYMEKHDVRHLPFLGKGPVIKYNAQQRYASDAKSSASIIYLCEQHAIPYQFFTSRNDMPCGSTIGPIHATNTGMPTVDIGTPQLSMHSCRELIAIQDHLEMCRLLASFLQS